MKTENKIKMKIRILEIERSRILEIVSESINNQIYDNDFYHFQLSKLAVRISELEWVLK